MEQAEYLSRFEQRGIKQEDVYEFIEDIRTESRYQALRCLSRERETILMYHLTFVQSPDKQKCVYRDRCVDNQLERLLFTRARRYSD